MQGEQYELDLTTAQATINKLEAEIAVMLRAQDLLDDQKQENVRRIPLSLHLSIADTLRRFLRSWC